MPAVRALLGLRLTVAPLKREAQRDIRFEICFHFLEKRQNRRRCLPDALEVAGGQRRELGRGALELLAQGGIEVGFAQCSTLRLASSRAFLI